jgi:two-component system CheB/CheR fusion protein
MRTITPHHIIAIGESAGGTDEIKTFFENTPLNGVAYIIVQPLSADLKSEMVELLTRHTSLIVLEAFNGMAISANHVYLIPNDQLLTVRNHRLYLTGKDYEMAPHLTINHFLHSLAAHHGKIAVAIILSGPGTDGSDGIVAIKKANGLVIAREPFTSKFPDMPSNAIATGMVDFVLEPSVMSEVILEYIQHQQEAEVGVQENENAIVPIISYIKEQMPLDFSAYKLTTLLRRTKRRATYTNFTSLDDYYEFLRTSPEELQTLTKDFLISVTSFFRDKEAFDLIETTILPELLANLSPGEELKMWIAGCATGEEVYSLAILIKEQLKGPYKNVTVKLFATDLDNAALLFAGKGLYHWSVVKDIPAERLQKYFISEKGKYCISPVIRQMVIFAQHDLVKNPPFCNMHFISCRNLLIYMTHALQKKIFSMLLFGLKYHGYLFLGSSETPVSIINHLEVISKKWRLYRNINKKRTLNFDTFSIPEPPTFIKINPELQKPDRNKAYHIAESVNNVLANELDHLAVCIDENYQVIKSYGDTTKYLLQQNFNSSLVELLPPQLALAFNTLIKKVSLTNVKAGASGIPVIIKGKNTYATLSIYLMDTVESNAGSFLILFTEDSESAKRKGPSQIFDQGSYTAQYVSNLELELKEVRDKLSAAYERINSYNENMQSFNEELISSNEEMQSTNEEMQSVNEELHTINVEYHLKNKQLLELNDDLNNYFRSNVNGQIFLNGQLQLMKFSPAAVKLINLKDIDIGRPVNHISTNIKMSNIIDDIRNVLDGGKDLAKDIETNEGHWYQMVIMPYIQQEGSKRDGVVISFNDITALKKAKIELDEKNESLLRINADLDHFIHMASHDLLDPLNNIESSISIMNLIDNGNSELMEYIQIINSSIKKFRLLIKSIGTIARLENNMTDMEYIDIGEVIGNIEWSLEKKIKKSNAVITTALDVKKVFFSQKNFRSILYNLISNAIKFSSQDGARVHIQTRQEGKHIILSVEDNGIGITPEGIKKLFTVYGRLNLHIEGHGVGLYLARKIIHAADGELKVESTPGMGSKFIIYLKCV